MYTFILVIDSGNQSFTARSIAAKIGVATEEASGRTVVEGPNGPSDGWIAVSAFNSDGYDYPEENYEKIKMAIETARMEKPLFFLIEGRDTNTSLADDLVASLDADTKTIIDNDHGIIAELSAFKKLVEMRVNWPFLSNLPCFD